MVVLITGASSGIGLACAEHLTTRGCRVYGASRRGPIAMDVRDGASVRAAVARILAAEGRIDAVINNAGIAIAGAVEDTSVEEAREQFDVNFFGVLRVCREVLPVMREQRAGCIINISSIAGLLAVPYQGLYSASKFALEGLTESLRLEVRDFGIRVVLVEPGDHRTAFTANRRQTQTSLAYRKRSEFAVGRMAADEQSGPGPERLARLVDRILNTPDPRLRYTVGPAFERAAVFLKRLVPWLIIEKIMTRYYS